MDKLNVVELDKVVYGRAFTILGRVGLFMRVSCGKHIKVLVNDDPTPIGFNGSKKYIPVVELNNGHITWQENITKCRPIKLKIGSTLFKSLYTKEK
jgi:hypothetical protein